MPAHQGGAVTWGQSTPRHARTLGQRDYMGPRAWVAPAPALQWHIARPCPPLLLYLVLSPLQRPPAQVACSWHLAGSYLPWQVFADASSSPGAQQLLQHCWLPCSHYGAVGFTAI